MKKQMKELLCRLAWFVLGVMVCGLLSWLLPKYGIGEQDYKDVTRDTVWVTKTQVKPVVRDSVTVRYVTKRVALTRDSVCGPDTNVVNKDTVEVELPIVLKEYGDSTYRAWVSGYDVALDSIKIMTPTITITKRERKRWGLGVQAGYGLQGAYVGIGITYNVIGF